MSAATPHSRRARLLAEAVATALLLVSVVGSGIMAERLAGGNQAIALLANSIATGAALAAILLSFAHVSGAHLNPAISLVDAALGGLPWPEVPGYLMAQVAGAFTGVATAHLLFGLPLFVAGTHVRTGGAQVLSEAVATFGLVSVVRGCTRAGHGLTAFAVGAWVIGAYWFTSSTAFANPAVTLARAATDTFTSIRARDVPGFLVGQALGAGLALLLARREASSSAREATGDRGGDIA